MWTYRKRPTHLLEQHLLRRVKHKAGHPHANRSGFRQLREPRRRNQEHHEHEQEDGRGKAHQGYEVHDKAGPQGQEDGVLEKPNDDGAVPIRNAANGRPWWTRNAHANANAYADDARKSYGSLSR